MAAVRILHAWSVLWDTDWALSVLQCVEAVALRLLTTQLPCLFFSAAIIVFRTAMSRGLQPLEGRGAAGCPGLAPECGVPVLPRLTDPAGVLGIIIFPCSATM